MTREIDNVTIVCCWNNQQQFKLLLKDIEKQNINISVLGIDNTKQRFKSCSSAYNYALKKVQSEFVIFMHQDILLPEHDIIQKFINYVKQVEDNSIIGVTGSTFDSEYVSTNVVIGENKDYGGSLRVNGISNCDTLDECMFGGRTKFFVNNQFDEVLCNGWHLYTVELCLRTKIRGGHVYVCDLSLIHNSNGVTDSAYNKCFNKLCYKYKNNYKFIRTPCCYATRTSFIYRNLYYLKNFIRIMLRRNL